jgi:ubiquinone/menaquinone biosynthesis C-methylase UbiE
MGLVAVSNDPKIKDWHSRELPPSWPDRAWYSTWLGSLVLFLYAIASSLGRRRAVHLSPELPGGSELPSYLLQEFHGMPNGYYSRRLAADYPRGFEIAMLGRMRGARRRIAEQLSGCGSVLEVGAGAGLLASELVDAGVADVWGLDACAYSVQVASRATPAAHFEQGLAERLPFADARFDGAAACFVFHELPHDSTTDALRELARVLRPGGVLTITEPSPAHLRPSWWSLISRFQLMGIYYRLLSVAVYEPYLDCWLDRDLPGSLAQAGFQLVEEQQGIPFHTVLARRV